MTVHACNQGVYGTGMLSQIDPALAEECWETLPQEGPVIGQISLSKLSVEPQAMTCDTYVVAKSGQVINCSAVSVLVLQLQTKLHETWLVLLLA